MTALARKLTFSAACIALLLASPCADAAASSCAPPVRHHAGHHHRHMARHRAARGAEIVKIAQRHLANLGYYTGAIDGVEGPATRRAIKAFQREHELDADGVLGRKTRSALADVDRPVPVTGRGTFVPRQSAAPGAPVNPDFTPTGSRTLSTRFGTVTIAEDGAGSNKRYSVNVNGQPILVADGQPTVVGVSPDYNLADEDAVIFTTYSPGDGVCMYKNHVLVLGGNGMKLLDINNCTRAYRASVTQGDLYITFPEPDDKRDVGAMWKLEGESLHRL